MDSNKLDLKVVYLYHSGFAVKTKNHLLIFDYYSKPGTDFNNLITDISPIEELEAQNIIVFSSHRHPDHFDKRILDWTEMLPNIQYVLSDDIKFGKNINKNILFVHFNREYSLDNLEIHTLHSTDEGVAFYIETDGINLYHGGDLNWWHWNGETKHYNDTMAGQYKHEIDLLKGKKIDVAFLPMDPRLEENYLLGIDYFIKTLQPEIVFPMHFGENYKVFDWLNKDDRADNYRPRIQNITHIGETFVIH
ncbi:L-ascorbate metabolism protein UlaG (beta-lactamase superfamily) [Mobilisporobacter senegalensis]|uniref:L-ascorbate metabolism protein UlaG (Beta-lactamase superfamily) n=1 Tax=Mobilisporobacter senegalensis TaxID=1329262 RepID=A0A3N1XBK4_9FIRM|nr:MBL fold metallo-hydrolase [Mobilisporobacter senegalensis]ROR22117.1 L-ascorbate metabolism protein UlaG (beta-lactamase superfamily) [Mobilisporobacter senegalensis]